MLGLTLPPLPEPGGYGPPERLRYNRQMDKFLPRLGALPFLLLGLALLWLGALATGYIVDNFWPFDPRLDLVRATALGRIDAVTILQSANGELIVAFLAGVAASITGLVLPLVYYLNRRFGSHFPSFWVVLRQSMWVGLWFAFCVWLQMNRTLGLAVALLVAAVFVMVEFLVQVRTRAVQAVGE
jgi:ABC-type xylose transport system permease subunit